MGQHKNSMAYLWQLALLTVVVVMLLRIFLFASFRVPTVSMQPTILPGDFILVNKLVSGPRMDWLALFGDDRYVRVPGIRAIRRGDVLVFNPPYYQSDTIARNLHVYYVKRCYGIPGDSVLLDRYGTFHQLKDVKASDRIVDGRSIYIPRQGEELLLDSANMAWYSPIMAYETGLRQLDKWKERDRYRFRQNYYLVVGDNPMNSEDSRFWGLLPEEHVVGKVAYIWKSVDPETGKYRFGRFFNSLDLETHD